MEDVVDRLVDPDALDDVLVQEREVLVANVLDVLERPGLEVVDADDAVAVRQQVVAEMGAEEPGAPGDDRSWHRAGIVRTGATPFVSKLWRADQAAPTTGVRGRARALPRTSCVLGLDLHRPDHRVVGRVHRPG